MRPARGDDSDARDQAANARSGRSRASSQRPRWRAISPLSGHCSASRARRCRADSRRPASRSRRAWSHSDRNRRAAKARAARPARTSTARSQTLPITRVRRRISTVLPCAGEGLCSASDFFSINKIDGKPGWIDPELNRQDAKDAKKTEGSNLAAPAIFAILDFSGQSPVGRQRDRGGPGGLVGSERRDHRIRTVLDLA